MKKLIFGLALMGSFLISNFNLKAQGFEDPAKKWVCCQSTGDFCEDWLGGANSNSRRVDATYCP